MFFRLDIFQIILYLKNWYNIGWPSCSGVITNRDLGHPVLATLDLETQILAEEASSETLTQIHSLIPFLGILVIPVTQVIFIVKIWIISELHIHKFPEE